MDKRTVSNTYLPGEHTNRRGGREYSTASLLILLLLVGVGVMVWYWTSDDAWAPTRTESVPVPVVAPAPTVAVRDAQSSGAATGTVYVVESQEQADFLGSAWVESFATANGVSWGTYGVVVLEAGQDAALLFSEEQRTRAKEGLPALAIVDMRAAGRFDPYP